MAESYDAVALLYKFFEYWCAFAAFAAESFSRAIFISSVGGLSFVKKRIAITIIKVKVGARIKTLLYFLFNFRLTSV